MHKKLNVTSIKTNLKTSEAVYLKKAGNIEEGRTIQWPKCKKDNSAINDLQDTAQ